jgi:hypothetical protein
MAKVVITATVADGARWESSFRTHGDIFQTYGLRGPVEFTVSGNEVALCVDPGDVPRA